MATLTGISTKTGLARRDAGSGEPKAIALTPTAKRGGFFEPTARRFVLNGKPLERLIAATLTPGRLYSSIARGFLEELRAVLSKACAPHSQGGYTTRGNLARSIGLPEERIDRWLATESTVVPTFAQVLDLITIEPGLHQQHKRRLVAFIAREAGMEVCDIVSKDGKPVEAQVNEVTRELGQAAETLCQARAAASENGQKLSVAERRAMIDALGDVVREAQELQMTLRISAEEAATSHIEEKRVGKRIDRTGSVLMHVPFVMASVAMYLATGLLGGFEQATLWFAIVVLFVVLNAGSIKALGTALRLRSGLGH